jgi:TPR repeat protein
MILFCIGQCKIKNEKNIIRKLLSYIKIIKIDMEIIINFENIQSTQDLINSFRDRSYFIKLYEKAIEYKKMNNYDNYFILMTYCADKNYYPAIECLYNDYQLGTHRKQNYEITREYYQLENGPWSSNYMAYMYHYGLGVSRDIKKACELYQCLAQKGNELAAFNLASIYETGNIYIPLNSKKAFKLYKMAAKRGNIFAMYCLANMYYHGRGVTQNYLKAFELYQNSAEKGCSLAINFLNIMNVKDHCKIIEMLQMVIKKNNNDNAMNLFINLLKNTGDQYKYQAIKFFISTNNVDKLKELYGYDDIIIGILQENFISESK